MKKTLLYLFIVLTNVTLVAQTKVALVIGNSKYKAWGELENPKNDAKDMKNLLESRGFDVLYGTDLTRNDFEDLIDEFRNKLAKYENSIGLFYFSGHGMEIDHSNYLIPIDSNSPKRYLNIELNRVIDDMSKAENRLNIIILDACRDNPFIRTFKGFNKGGGFSKIDTPPRGLLIAYATEAGKMASDGDETQKNGLFTKYLLQYMQQPLPLYSVFRKTREAVDKESSHEQFPAIYDNTVGNFFFTQPKSKEIEKSTTSTSASTLLHIPLYCDYQGNDFD